MSGTTQRANDSTVFYVGRHVCVHSLVMSHDGAISVSYWIGRIEEISANLNAYYTTGRAGRAFHGPKEYFHELMWTFNGPVCMRRDLH